MLEIVRNSIGEILGACEFFVVNKDGSLNDKGEYVWINECEVSKSSERKGILAELIRMIIPRCPSANYGYFWRKRKYPQRTPRLYSRRQWLNLIKEK